MNLVRPIKSIRAWLAVTAPELKDDQVHYIQAWHRGRIAAAAEAIALGGLVTAILSMLPIAVMAPASIKGILLTVHAAIATMLLTWRLALSRLTADPRLFFFVTSLMAAAGYAIAVAFAFRNDPLRDNIVFLTSMFMAVTVFNVLLCPYANIMILVMAGIELLLGLVAWGGEKNLATFVLSHAGYLGFAVLLQYVRVHRHRYTALQEHETRRLSHQNEKLRIEAANKERSIARLIQDGVAMPPPKVDYGGLTVSFYHRRHDALGGDWTAVRACDDGSLVVLVVDAAGYGVRAAMVVHAVQTLWSAVPERAAFDPEAWIRTLNETLIAMGRIEPCRLELGLAVVRQDQLTYFSAGGIPLFLLAGEGTSSRLTPVIGKGNILGITHDLRLEPTVVRPESRPFSLVIGTDGILEKGLGMDRSELVELLAGLERRGSAALAGRSGNDDKVLVLVRSASG